MLCSQCSQHCKICTMMMMLMRWRKLATNERTSQRANSRVKFNSIKVRTRTNIELNNYFISVLYLELSGMDGGYVVWAVGNSVGISIWPHSANPISINSCFVNQCIVSGQSVCRASSLFNWSRHTIHTAMRLVEYSVCVCVCVLLNNEKNMSSESCSEKTIPRVDGGLGVVVSGGRIKDKDRKELKGRLSLSCVPCVMKQQPVQKQKAAQVKRHLQWHLPIASSAAPSCTYRRRTTTIPTIQMQSYIHGQLRMLSVSLAGVCGGECRMHFPKDTSTTA